MSRPLEHVEPGGERLLKWARGKLAQLTRFRQDCRLPALRKSYQVDGSLVSLKSSDWGDMIRITGGAVWHVYQNSAPGNVLDIGGSPSAPVNVSGFLSSAARSPAGSVGIFQHADVGGGNFTFVDESRKRVSPFEVILTGDVSFIKVVKNFDTMAAVYGGSLGAKLVTPDAAHFLFPFTTGSLWYTAPTEDDIMVVDQREVSTGVHRVQVWSNKNAGVISDHTFDATVNPGDFVLPSTVEFAPLATKYDLMYAFVRYDFSFATLPVVHIVSARNGIVASHQMVGFEIGATQGHVGGTTADSFSIFDYEFSDELPSGKTAIVIGGSKTTSTKLEDGSLSYSSSRFVFPQVVGTATAFLGYAFRPDYEANSLKNRVISACTKDKVYAFLYVLDGADVPATQYIYSLCDDGTMNLVLSELSDTPPFASQNGFLLGVVHASSSKPYLIAAVQDPAGSTFKVRVLDDVGVVFETDYIFRSLAQGGPSVGLLGATNDVVYVAATDTGGVVHVIGSDGSTFRPVDYLGGAVGIAGGYSIPHPTTKDTIFIFGFRQLDGVFKGFHITDLKAREEGPPTPDMHVYESGEISDITTRGPSRYPFQGFLEKEAWNP